MASKIKITLTRSLIGRSAKHVQIAKQLGLRKINSEVTQPDNPAIRGMVNRINYMLEVEECK